MGKVRTMYGSSWRAALGALVALACLPLPAQEVYKSVDAQGHVVYSDRGTTKTAPKTALHVEEPDPAEAARLAKQQQILDAQEQQRAEGAGRERPRQGARGPQAPAEREVLRERPQQLLPAAGNEPPLQA